MSADTTDNPVACMNPNIVLITIDSLRADRCGHLNQDVDLTPTIDRMARNGICFRDAIAPGPKTPESMPAIFTGQYPTGHRTDSDLDSWQAEIESHMLKRETIPEFLSDRGYETIAFTPNGFTSRYFGFDEGFDFFKDFLDEDIRPGFDVPNHLRGLIKLVRQEGNWKRWEGYYDDVVDRVRDASQPYFLWVFLLDVHSPYMVPRAYRRENSWLEMMYANWRAHNVNDPDAAHGRLVSAYEDTVRYVDAFVDRLTTDLDDTDPAYLIHSDHGEALSDHGVYGHEQYLYEENVRVPFVIDGVPASATVDRPVSLRSIPDAIRTIADGDAASLPRRYEAGRVPVVAHSTEGGRTAVRTARYKYIATPDGDELYDLETDPNERENLAAELTGLRDALHEYVRSFRNDWGERVTLPSTLDAGAL